MTVEFTQKMSDYICEQLAEGRSLISICKDDNVPSRGTINKWIRENEEFCANIARAREEQADYYLDKQIEFTELATGDDFQLRRFQADNLKWVASKLRPKKYGDKLEVKNEHSGSVTVEATLSPLSEIISEFKPGASEDTV
jgi:hypothetical protein